MRHLHVLALLLNHWTCVRAITKPFNNIFRLLLLNGKISKISFLYCVWDLIMWPFTNAVIDAGRGISDFDSLVGRVPVNVEF